MPLFVLNFYTCRFRFLRCAQINLYITKYIITEQNNANIDVPVNNTINPF